MQFQNITRTCYLYTTIVLSLVSFFVYASSLHSFPVSELYGISVAVNSNKSWSSNWKNGIKRTGLIKIDSLIDNYDLDINFAFESESTYWIEIKSKVPINFFALMEKFKTTSEFLFVEPFVLVGGGSSISLKVEGNFKYYKYYSGWGDCPSGCINHHYWVVRLKEQELTLFEEDGNPLN